VQFPWGMKPHEQTLREERPPYTLVLRSGERILVRSQDHLFLPPKQDAAGTDLDDADRSDFFQVWGDGQRYRWVSFAAITTIEATAPAG
jgi:hypothetical protein